MAAGQLALGNLPRYHVFDYIHIARWYPYLRQCMLDSKGLRHSYLLVEVPQHLRLNHSLVGHREVFADCVFFIHKGAHGELPGFYRSPDHGSARFCYCPETGQIEVYEVCFHYLGHMPSMKMVTFYQSKFHDTKLGIHAGDPWCILKRSLSKEEKPQFISWAINSPIMDRHHHRFDQQMRSYL